jgi:putative ABC transport system substrate-binding protein
MASHIGRRKFLVTLSGAAAWPLTLSAQQPEKLPVVGFVSSRSLDGSTRHAAAFTKGLSELGYVEGQNVAVEYHWLSGQHDRLPTLMADLVRRRVAAIAAVGDPATVAAKAATATIPIAFGVSGDPVRHGLVVSLARPGGNATGINFFTAEVLTKRLGLLHELVPKAIRVAVMLICCTALRRDWHIASFRCDAEFGRYRGKADIDQAAPIKLDL